MVICVEELKVGFYYITLLPFWARFMLYFLEIVVEVRFLEQLHVLQVWLGVSKGMLPTKRFSLINPQSCGSKILLC